MQSGVWHSPLVTLHGDTIHRDLSPRTPLLAISAASSILLNGGRATCQPSSLHVAYNATIGDFRTIRHETQAHSGFVEGVGWVGGAGFYGVDLVCWLGLTFITVQFHVPQDDCPPVVGCDWERDFLSDAVDHDDHSDREGRRYQALDDVVLIALSIPVSIYWPMPLMGIESPFVKAMNPGCMGVAAIDCQ